MDDNVMYVWQVVQGHEILFTCARQEVAEYLLDWCEAEEYDRWVNSRSLLVSLLGEERADTMKFYLDKFSIQEGEVIL